MTEHFRTIADRATGDGDPRAIDIRPGDRVTFGESQGPGLPVVDRIEKPLAEHDHAGQPKVWCTRCQHEHVASIPATTYMCDSCGFGQWDLGTAAVHEASTPGHRTYPIAHPTVPLDERPAVPTAAGVLHEIITRIDEARLANGGTTSPWGNTDVLELLVHIRQPYTEVGATADALPTREPHAYVDGRFGDDGLCHARTDDLWPGRCYRPRADRVHDVPSTLRDVTPPKGDDRG